MTDLRLGGAAMVILSGMVWGQLAARALVERCLCLEACLVVLDVLETEVASGALPLRDAMVRASEVVGAGPVSRALAGASRTLGSDAGFGPVLWSELRRHCPRLSPGDLGALELLCGYLGRLDRREQLRQLRLTRDRLKTCLGQARDRRRRTEGLYRYLGPLGGIAVVVLLL